MFADITVIKEILLNGFTGPSGLRMCAYMVKAPPYFRSDFSSLYFFYLFLSKVKMEKLRFSIMVHSASCFL